LSLKIKSTLSAKHRLAINTIKDVSIGAGSCDCQ